MTGEEVLAEVDWLLSFRVHPEVIAAQMGRTLTSIEKLAVRHNRPDIRGKFQRADSARRGRDGLLV